MRLIFWRLLWLSEWIKLILRSEKSAQNIVWIPKLNLKYFFRTSFIWDLELLRRLYEANSSYRVCWGLKSVGKITKSRIYYNPQYDVNLFSDSYETRIYPIVSSIFEENNNSVNPTSQDILLWENKIVMHERFTELNIPHPRSALSYNMEECLNLLASEEKVILKPSHSKSSIGIREIESEGQLNVALESPEGGFILQKVEEIDSDCRIIIIRGEIILQYWRNKPASKQKKFVTTATSNGSRVLFNQFPAEIGEFAIQNTKKLGLQSAAWDLIIVNDEVLALEVSPVYYPNAYENYDEIKPYKVYKKSFMYPKYMRREFSKHIFMRLKSENTQ